MKIAIIIRRLNVKGGAQRQALSLAKEIKKSGGSVKIYTFIYSPSNCYENLLNDLEVVSLDYYPKHVNYFIDLFLENKAAKKLAQLIDKDTDILNPHDQVSYRVAYYFKKKIREIPSVWMMNDLPLKSWSFWRDSQFDSRLKLSLIRRFFYWMVDCHEIIKFIRAQDKILVLDNRDKNWVRHYFNKEAVVIRSGLNTEEFFYRQRHPLVKKEIKLLMVGIFFPHRRFEDGIEAVKLLKEKNYKIKLTIVGDYQVNIKYYQKLYNLIKELRLTEEVSFIGKVSEERLKDYYQESDIFLFPNHLQSWGLAVFEAMASGLPVVVSRTAGASEILSDKENALLVNPQKPEEITQGIETMIKELALYRDLSEKGRQFVKTNISWQKYSQRMLEIFNETR